MAWPTKAEREAKRTMTVEAPQGFDMNALVSSIKDAIVDDLKAELSELRGRVEQLQDSTPQYRAIEHPESLTDARRAAYEDSTPGNREGGMNYPVTSDGERVDMRFMRPAFKQGQKVRIRLDAKKDGFPRAGDPFPAKWEVDSKGQKRITSNWRKWDAIFPGQPEDGGEFPQDVTWGDVLKPTKCKGEGVIKSRRFLRKDGVWKYAVRVSGLTSKDGDGFDQNELVAV